jgi:hypothetical protein
LKVLVILIFASRLRSAAVALLFLAFAFASPLNAAGPDINGDGKVDDVDLAIVSRCLGQAPVGDCQAADIDGDGVINNGDLGLVRAALGAPIEPPDQFAVRISQELTSATSPEAELKAIIDCLRGIGIGIYTTDGQPLMSGAERGPGDFYVYDFEEALLSTMIESLDQADYRQLLLDLELADTNPYNDPAAFHGLLTSATAEAVLSPDDCQSFVLLLVRELGRRAPVPYDLAANPPIESVKLSAVQQWLIGLEVRLSLIALYPPVPPETYEPEDSIPSLPGPSLSLISRMRTSSTSERPRVEIPSPVKKLLSWGVGKLAVKLGVPEATVKTVARGAGIATSIAVFEMTEAHAWMLRRLIEIVPDNTPLEFYYGPNTYPIGFKVTIPKAKWDLLDRQLTFESRGIFAPPGGLVPQLPLFPVIGFGPLIRLKLPSGWGDQERVSVEIDYGGLLGHLKTPPSCAPPCSQGTDASGHVGVIITTKEDKCQGLMTSAQPCVERSDYGFVTATVDTKKTYGAKGFSNSVFALRASVPYTITWRVPVDVNLLLKGTVEAHGSFLQVTDDPASDFYFRDSSSVHATVTYSFVQAGPVGVDSFDAITEYSFQGEFVFQGGGYSVDKGDGTTVWLGCPNNVPGTVHVYGSNVYSFGNSWSVSGLVKVIVDARKHTTTIIPSLIDIQNHTDTATGIQAAGFEPSCGGGGSGVVSSTQEVEFRPNWGTIEVPQVPPLRKWVEKLPVQLNDIPLLPNHVMDIKSSHSVTIELQTPEKQQ